VVSPTGIAGAGATIALGVKIPKIKTINQPMKSRALPIGAAALPPIGAAVRLPLRAHAAADEGLHFPRDRVANRVSLLLQPLVMAVGVAMSVRPLLRPLAMVAGAAIRVRRLLHRVRKDSAKDRKRGEEIFHLALARSRAVNVVRPLLRRLAMAVGVTAHVGLLRRSVRKNAGKDRARDAALRRPLALLRAPDSVAARVRNDPLARRNAPLLPEQLDDLHPADRAAVPPGAVRVAVGIGARKRVVISRRDQFAVTDDILALAAELLTVVAPPLIAVPRTAEATASAIGDTLAARNIVA
jgi:hypothetical protein